MSLDFLLDGLLVYGAPRSFQFFLLLLLASLLARLLEQYVALALNSARVPWAREGAPEPRARRHKGLFRALFAPFFARFSSPFRRSPRSLRLTPSALADGEGQPSIPSRRAPASRLTPRELSPDGTSGARGAALFLNGALLSGNPASPAIGALWLEASALSSLRPASLTPRALGAGAPLTLGAPLLTRPASGAEIWEKRAWSLPAFWEEGDALAEGADLSRDAPSDSPRVFNSRAFLGGSSLGESSRSAEGSRRDSILFREEAFPPLPALAPFPRAGAPFSARARENARFPETPSRVAPDPENRPAPFLSLAPSVSREKEASCGLLGLIRERLASEGVDLNNLGLSPLKMAGAQTGQALLELVRRAVSDSNPSPHPKEDAPALPSPPQREDFAAAGLAWDKLQRESAFWRTLKVSPALSSWRKGFSPEELDAIFAGLESLALEKMEREHALANKLHPRFLLASDPARAEERRLIQEKAEKILAGRANSLTLFPSLDAEALPLQGPVLASVCHVAGANPENSENNADRALLFLEANGKTPLGYLDLGPAPASLKRVLGAIGRFSRERDRVKVLLAGAEYFDGRKKLMVKETPVSQKDGWMESFLRARLAAGSSPLKGGAPIALPARSGEWGRLVAFYSPGVGKERQTALRETLSRILKEQKRFWGEKADEKARAFFQATVRRHRRRTGLKVLGSLFEESRAPGGELVWKIAAEKRALAESVFDFTVLRAAVSAKVIGDAELRRLYRRRQEISREIASLAGPRDFNLELWLKFFGESWRASPASAREKAPRGENAPRAEAAFQEESAPDGKGGPVGAPLGPPREDFPAGSFLWERLYELLASQKAREERPPLASLAEPSKPTP